jgi:hypothetical protein
MTRDELLARKKDLQGGVAMLRSQIEELDLVLQHRQKDLAATNGALAEIDFWLRLMDDAEARNGE